MSKLNRREFFERALVVGAAAAAGVTLMGCKGGGGALSCTDETGLSAADKSTRTANGYIDATTDAAKRCDGCALYTVAAAEGTCGGCTVVKGPINPAGYCNLWVAKS